MASLNISTIAPGSIAVKSNRLGERTKSQSVIGTKSFRPDVLSKMPRFCNLLFDIMRTAIDPSGLVTVSIRELGKLARISHTQAQREEAKRESALLQERGVWYTMIR